jgi:hypothetical protein
MSPGAFYSPFSKDARERRSIALATIVAILFATVAAVSFAVDISVTLSSLPVPAATAGR